MERRAYFGTVPIPNRIEYTRRLARAKDRKPWRESIAPAIPARSDSQMIPCSIEHRLSIASEQTLDPPTLVVLFKTDECVSIRVFVLCHIDQTMFAHRQRWFVVIL